MNTPLVEFEVGQWVRSLPVGQALAFVGQILKREDEEYVVRDDWNRRFARTIKQLETLQ